MAWSCEGVHLFDYFLRLTSDMLQQRQLTERIVPNQRATSPCSAAGGVPHQGFNRSFKTGLFMDGFAAPQSLKMRDLSGRGRPY
eukprot:symbB.v1.2.005748.t1/scaffold307.1/size232847/13